MEDGATTEYYEGDDWPVAPSSIDLVLCTEVLEHVEAPAPSVHRTRSMEDGATGQSSPS
jgi:2-polyprenyl-3-methyl-5-hydroxy-6-metoxy-1,4-benzoquinol methylase